MSTSENSPVPAPVRVALVGCGSIGRRHAAVLDAEPGVDLCAVCDIRQPEAQKLADLYPGCRVFDSYADMLADSGAGMVVIATPHAWHARMAIEALQAGKHVLVEKPMALSSADCRLMVEAAREAGRKLWVVKQNRHNVPVRLAQEVIRAGHLGRIFLVKCDVLWNRYQGYYDDSPWRGKIREEGGALFTQASHFIDLLIWWCGDITESHACMDTLNHSIETEDVGSASVRFSSGAVGSIVWTTCVHERNLEGSITLIGEKGTIRIGGEYLNRIEHWDVPEYPLPGDIRFEDEPNRYGKYQGTSSNHDKVIREIVGYLNGGPEQPVEGWEGLRSVEAIEVIYSSARK